MNKKRFLKILFLFAMLLLSFGCGKIKSGKSLFEWAKSEYGDCTIVSMSETDDKTIVVLHDTLQDFDYEVVDKDSCFKTTTDYCIVLEKVSGYAFRVLTVMGYTEVIPYHRKGFRIFQLPPPRF